MRFMSFAETQIQIRNKTKTVTRRMGWYFLKIGDILLPVNKVMGFKKGEHPIAIQCPIRIINIRKEPLWWITPEDCIKEGFPDLSPEAFIKMFCRINAAKKCTRNSIVHAIEFEYTK